MACGCKRYPTSNTPSVTCSSCDKCNNCCTCGKQVIHKKIDCTGKHITELGNLPGLTNSDMFLVYDFSERKYRSIKAEDLADWVCDQCSESIVIPTLIEGTYGGPNKYVEITINADGYITSVLEGDDTILGNADVQAGSPLDEQILVWDAATLKWVFQDLPTFTETTTVDDLSAGCGVGLVEEPSPRQYKVAKLAGSALINVTRDPGDQAFISTIGGFFRQFEKSAPISGLDATGFTEVDFLDSVNYNEAAPTCGTSDDVSNKRLTQKRIWLKDSDFIIEEVADNIKVSVDFTEPLSAIVTDLVETQYVTGVHHVPGSSEHIQYTFSISALAYPTIISLVGSQYWKDLSEDIVVRWWRGSEVFAYAPSGINESAVLYFETGNDLVKRIRHQVSQSFLIPGGTAGDFTITYSRITSNWTPNPATEGFDNTKIIQLTRYKV